MAFTQEEIIQHLAVIEEYFWSKRRPPHNIRHLMREGQRVEGQTVELFFVRPRYNGPGEVEEPFAKIKFVRTKNHWMIFWQRASGKWVGYEPHPTTDTLREALLVVNADEHHCFFG